MREGYKETSVGVIPEDWEVVKLGKITTEYKEKCVEDNQFEVLTSSNRGLMLQTDYYGENRLTTRSTIGFNICPNNYLTYRSRSDNGSFTFNRNTLGFTGLISKYYPVFYANNGNNSYLEIMCNWYSEEFSKYSVGTSQKVLSYNAISDCFVANPPLPEQEKIASILTIVDDKIESIDKQIESATELKKGLMQKLFQEGIGHSEFKDSPVGRIPAEWEVKKLKNCVNFIAGYAFSSKDFTDKGTQLVRMGNLYQNRLSLERNPVYLPDSFVNDNPRYVIKSGDIILSMTGTAGKEDYGFAVVIPQMNNVLLLNQRVVKLEWLDNCEQFYLAQYLWTRYFLDQLYSLPGGTKQANLSVKQIESIVIPLPSKDEQKQIADILTCADDKISVLKEKKEAYTKLKKGLMQKLLTGEVRVKVDA